MLWGDGFRAVYCYCAPSQRFASAVFVGKDGWGQFDGNDSTCRRSDFADRLSKDHAIAVVKLPPVTLCSRSERQAAVGQGVFHLSCGIPILGSPSVWRGFFDVVDHKNLNRPFVRR
jgi:hypothetical protein